MDLIADILLVAGTMSAAFYCFILSRRLSKFTDLEKGVGGAIAVLSAQVDDMTKTLERAQVSASGSTTTLRELTGRAEDVARQLELFLASMHDLPTAPETQSEPSVRTQESSPGATPPAEATEPEPAKIKEPVSLFRSARSESQGAAA